jgi:chorismate mutase
MSSPNQRLDLLRREIDEIDDAIHDLIVKRGTIVEDIRKIKKQSGSALRPGREATILRRISAKHQGAFPLPALISLWREMMGGFTHMQQPFSCAVFAPDGNHRLNRLARNHFGSLTPLNAMPTASACVRAVADGVTDVAILPVPIDGESEAWWTLLMGDDAKAPKVVARLPFVGEDDDDEALVISPWARDYSEVELSLIAIRLGERTSRSRIIGVMVSAGFLDPVHLAAKETNPEDCCHLIEVVGISEALDQPKASLAKQFGDVLIEAHVIGGYARPLALSSNTGKN